MRRVVHAICTILALPFQIVSGIAFLLLGLQTLLAVVNLLGGTSLSTAISNWAWNLTVLAVVAIGSGVVGLVISVVGSTAEEHQPKSAIQEAPRDLS